MERSGLRALWRLVSGLWFGSPPLDILLNDRDPIPGLRVLLLVVHWLAWLWVLFRTFLYFYVAPVPQTAWGWLSYVAGALLLYLLVVGWCTVGELGTRSAQGRPFRAWAEILAGISLFTVYYSLPAARESGFLLLYGLPLFVAIEAFSFRWLLAVLALLIVCAVVPPALKPDTIPDGWFIVNVLLPRSFFLGFMALVGSVLWSFTRARVHLFWQLLNQVQAGISVIDRNHRLLYVNHWGKKLCQSGAVGKTCHWAFHALDAPCDGCPADKVFTGLVHTGPTLINHHINGEERTLEVISAPYRGGTGRIIAAISVLTDVSAHRARAARMQLLQNASSAALAADFTDDKELETCLRQFLEVLTGPKGLGCMRAFLVTRCDGELTNGLIIESVRHPDQGAAAAPHVQTKPCAPSPVGGEQPALQASATLRPALAPESWQAFESALCDNGWDPMPLTGETLATEPWLPLTAALPALQDPGPMIVAPLRAMGGLTGLLVAGPWPYKTGGQESEEAGFLRLCALQASQALENARLSAELVLLLKWQTELQQDLEGVYSKTRSGGAAERRESPLAPPLQRAIHLLRAAFGAIFLVTPTGDHLAAATAYPTVDKSVTQVEMGKGIVGLAAEEDASQQVTDYGAWCEAHPNETPITTEAELRALIAIPLQFRDKCLGVLVVAHQDTAKCFTPTDLKALERIADGIAAAIGNARDHVQLQTLVDRLPVPLIAVDEEGKVTQFNRAAEELTGRKSEEVLRTKVKELYVGELATAQKINKQLQLANRDGKLLKDARPEIKHADGHAIPILLSGAVTADERGEPSGSLGIMEDLSPRTEQQRREADQQQLLAELSYASPEEQIKTEEDLRERTRRMLAKAGQYLGCAHLLLLASWKEGHTVLTPVADWWAGDAAKLPGLQFNWRKAGLLNRDASGSDDLAAEAATLARWHKREGWDPNLLKGLPKAWSERLSEMDFAVPIRLVDSYRALVVFGSAGGQQSVTERRRLQRNIAEAVARDVLSRIQTMALTAEREAAREAARLVLHRTNMQLLQVNGLFGAIVREANQPRVVTRVASAGEGAVATIAKIIGTGLVSRYAELELEDYHRRVYPLAALVQNCAESFQDKAKKAGKELMVDPSIERLPEALVDPAALFAALSNLMDNAIKYSFESTQVRVFSDYDTRQATITVEDRGERMPNEATRNLQGLRGRHGMSPRARQLPGWGLGLCRAEVAARRCPHPALR